MNKIILTICLIGFAVASNPVAIFHGFGDACANPGMKSFTKQIAAGVNGAYVKCVEIGNGAMSSVLMRFDKQVENACKSIKADPNFQGKTINVLGLSQGGLIARGIIETCDFGGSVARLISIGGPQMGVATIPKCHKGIFCNILNGLVDDLVYTPLAQKTVGPAGYFRNPKHYSAYLKHSIFLPIVNNEREVNQTYKDRFVALEKVQLTMFSKDSVIDPKETAWFSFYGTDGKTIVGIQQQDVFTQDLFGLKTVYDAGKVEFITIDGDHLRFSTQDIQNIYIPALQ
ncbi:hypothetical protein ABPG74_022189 [Tetrahymena malaccensis]